jgi:hypothetical protein
LHPVDRYLAKVGVESSNLFARSITSLKAQRAIAPAAHAGMSRRGS